MQKAASKKVKKKAINNTISQSKANSVVNTPAICFLLRDLRVKANIGVPELAKRTGLTRDHILRLESATDSEIRISTLIVLLDAMGYDLLIQKRKALKAKQ